MSKLNSKQVQTTILIFVLSGTLGLLVGVSAAQESGPDVSIDDNLREQERDGVEAVIRFTHSKNKQNNLSQLKDEMARSRVAVEKFAESRKGIEIKNSLWLANAVVVVVDRKKLSLEEVASIEGVESIHANFEVKLSGVVENSSQVSTVSNMNTTAETDYETETKIPSQSSDYTYGLEQINAPQVWSQFGTRGEGSKVAVLDTGVDAGHPDIDLYTEDPGDSTYPGGWAEFDGSGNQVSGSEPRDTDSHGTHVSGTVSGGDESGTSIGVAPETDLMHGLVLPGGRGQFAQVVGGMQWAVENDADVISMSLGSQGYSDAWIDPVRNAQDMGTLVVSSSGNSGEGTSGSPGNVYDSISVGASNSNEGIADFSSGEGIVTQNAWNNPPSDWPSEYVVPDVSAPGAGVMSSVPGGGYQNFDGTSMAAPHVSGVAALMISAAGESDDLSPGDIRSTLETTAWKPDGWGEPENERDTRYGFGIVDAREATELVAIGSGINGTVTGTSGQPVEGAEVSVNGRTVTTGPNGRYQIRAPEGEYTVTATGFGYESETISVTVVSESFTTRNIMLNEKLAVRKSDGQPSGVQAGDSFELSFDVANLEEYTVETAGGFPEQDTTLRIDGNEYDFGETIALTSPHHGEFNVTIETTSSDAVPTNLSLEHSFSGLQDIKHISTGPTEMLEELIDVGVVDNIGQYGDEVALALKTSLPPAYSVEVTNSQLGDHDVYVVQSTNNDTFIQDTLSPSVPAVYLDHWGSSSNGVQRFVEATQDPGTFQKDWNAAPPVFHEIDQNHPIVENVGSGSGDRVDIHDHPDGDHAWFNDIDDFDVLASVGDQQEGLRGPALAVDENKNVVLASSLGRTQYARNEDFTEKADMLLTNSITYLMNDNSGGPGVTMSSESVALDDSGDTGESAIKIDAEEGVSIANVEVSVGMSVAEIMDVHAGADVNEGSSAVTFDVVDQTTGTVLIEYANIQAQSDSVEDFELAKVQFEAQTEDGEAQIGMSSEGVYDGNQNEYGEVELEEGTLTVGSLFGSPLPGFDSAPTNTGELNDTLYEDVNGDGDGLDTTQTVTLWTELVVNGDEFDGLNQEQVDALDWNGDGELTPEDAVSLWTEQVVAG